MASDTRGAPPTEPGWYWAKYTRASQWEAVYVRRCADGSLVAHAVDSLALSDYDAWHPWRIPEPGDGRDESDVVTALRDLIYATCHACDWGDGTCVTNAIDRAETVLVAHAAAQVEVPRKPVPQEVRDRVINGWLDRMKGPEWNDDPRDAAPTEPREPQQVPVESRRQEVRDDARREGESPVGGNAESLHEQQTEPREPTAEASVCDAKWGPHVCTLPNGHDGDHWQQDSTPSVGAAIWAADAGPFEPDELEAELAAASMGEPTAEDLLGPEPDDPAYTRGDVDEMVGGEPPDFPSAPEARAELLAIGLDPDEIGRRGTVLANALLERNRLRAQLADLREALEHARQDRGVAIDEMMRLNTKLVAERAAREQAERERDELRECHALECNKRDEAESALATARAERDEARKLFVEATVECDTERGYAREDDANQTAARHYGQAWADEHFPIATLESEPTE